MSDIRVENHGSIALLRPLTPAGQEWLDAHVQEALWYAGAVACEPRMVEGVVCGALDDGLEVVS